MCLLVIIFKLVNFSILFQVQKHFFQLMPTIFINFLAFFRMNFSKNYPFKNLNRSFFYQKFKTCLIKPHYLQDFTSCKRLVQFSIINLFIIEYFIRLFIMIRPIKNQYQYLSSYKNCLIFVNFDSFVNFRFCFHQKVNLLF